MKSRLFLVFVSGCCASSAPGTSSPDAPATPDVVTTDVVGLDTATMPNPDAAVIGPNPFPNADELGCSELPEAWFTQLDAGQPAANSCVVDADCVLVDTDVNCKEYGLGDHTVAGCQSAVRVAEEGTWTQYRDELAHALCTARTIPICASFSLCPPDIMARCVDTQCRAL